MVNSSHLSALAAARGIRSPSAMDEVGLGGEMPTVDHRLSFFSASAELKEARTEVERLNAVIAGMDREVADHIELAAKALQERNELHFDARVALPEAQSDAEMWEKRAGELSAALQDVKNRHYCTVGP